MAKVKEVTVFTSFTKNLGNYQSAKFEAGVTMTVEDGENVSRVYSEAWDLVGEEITKQVKEFNDTPTVKKGI